MPRAVRNNQPQGHLRRAPTIQSYAAQRLNLALNPDKPIALNEEARTAIDACAIVASSVHAYAPQQSERLRAIFREMLAGHIDFNTI